MDHCNDPPPATYPKIRFHRSRFQAIFSAWDIFEKSGSGDGAGAALQPLAASRGSIRRRPSPDRSVADRLRGCGTAGCPAARGPHGTSGRPRPAAIWSSATARRCSMKRGLVLGVVDHAAVEGHAGPVLLRFPELMEGVQRGARRPRPGCPPPAASRRRRVAPWRRGRGRRSSGRAAAPSPATPASVRTIMSLMKRPRSGMGACGALGSKTSRKWRNPLAAASSRNAL